MIQEIWNMLEANFDIFKSIIIPQIVLFLCGLLKEMSLKFREHKEKKIFELYCKRESDNFYAWIMICEVMIYLFSFTVVFLIGTLLQYVASFWGYELKIDKRITMIIAIMLSIGISFLILKVKWTRKRLLGDRWGKEIIIYSILLLNIGIICRTLDGVCVIKQCGLICLILYFVCEIFGLLHFQGRYIRYDFSSMKLSLNNGENIICNDIEKIYRRKKFIVIENGVSNIVLQYDNIWKAEYYGAPKIVVKNDIDKVIWQSIKNRLKKG